MLSCQRATVRLMPSIVIEPFGTTYRANSSGTSTPNHQFSPSGVRCDTRPMVSTRSEEHTSELQSHLNLVCRLLLEKKKQEGHSLRACHVCDGAELTVRS